MSIDLNFKVIARLAMILAAGLSVACGEIKLQGPEQGAVDPDLSGYGTLKLTSEQFPEGAESLVLAITELGGGDADCHVIRPLSNKRPTGEGLGLRSVVRPDGKVDCIPVVYDQGGAKKDAKNHALEKVQVFHLKRGEEIQPIRLRTGSYHVIADFFDKGGVQLYTGSEVFAIQDGEQKAIKIRLKKIESGQVTIGFEVEKPIFLPKRISSDTRFELIFQTTGNKNSPLTQRSLDLDLKSGVAIVRVHCFEGNGVACKAPKVEKKLNLSKTALGNIIAITSEVTLKPHQPGQACAQRAQNIGLVVTRCQECEAEKRYVFDNSVCELATHDLTSDASERIWQIVNSKTNTPVLNAAVR